MLLTALRAKTGNVMQAANMRLAIGDTQHHMQLTGLPSTSNSKVGPSNLAQQQDLDMLYGNKRRLIR